MLSWQHWKTASACGMEKLLVLGGKRLSNSLCSTKDVDDNTLTFLSFARIQNHITLKLICHAHTHTTLHFPRAFLSWRSRHAYRHSIKTLRNQFASSTCKSYTSTHVCRSLWISFVDVHVLNKRIPICLETQNQNCADSPSRSLGICLATLVWQNLIYIYIL